MKKLTGISLAALLAASTFVGCNSDYTVPETVYQNVAVQSFSLAEDDSVLVHLDSVFFSIDLGRGRIFNADSLPYGTKIDRLIPKITMMQTVSKAELKVTRANGTDTTYNYLENSTDSIDFSHGPVILTLNSFSGTTSAQYSIEVLVHKEKSDSLVWNQTAVRPLPSTLDNVSMQKTVSLDNTVYCMTTDGQAYDLASKANGTEAWNNATPALPENARIETFSANNEALFIIAGGQAQENGKLFISTDKGLTWSDTGTEMAYIYGAYGSKLLGNSVKNSSYYLAYYPAEASEQLVPDDMPVAETSQTWDFTFPMAQNIMTVFVGGEKSNGTQSNATWAYDGSSWNNISVKPLPDAIAGMTLVPFYSFTVSPSLVATQYEVLLAFGGTGRDEANRTVYISYDYGMTWDKGGEYIQLPDYIPSLHGSQAYIDTTTFYAARSCNDWREYLPSYRIPANAMFELPFATASRATRPVAEWECPFIYLYGGKINGGKCSDTIWRGTINRLMFKPII